MRTTRFRHGHEQDHRIIEKIADLPVVEPEVTEDEQEFGRLLDDAVRDYVDYQLERVYGALLGDVFNVMISHLAVTDAPEIYQKMRDALLGSYRSHVERHLLTFSHELHTGLDAEVQSYKNGDPAINPHGPYYFLMYNHPDRGKIYSDPLPLTLTEDEREDAKEKFYKQWSCTRVDVMDCWSTGNLKAHFQAYLTKIYKRALLIEELIEFCESCSWINQSLAQFSAGAQILNGEVQGVVLTYIGSTTIQPADFILKGEVRKGADAAYEGRIVTAADANKGLPVAYPGLEHLRAVAFGGRVRSRIENEKVLRVTSQNGENLQFLHEDADGRKVPIPGITPLPVESGRTEKVYELPAKHFKRELYFATA